MKELSIEEKAKAYDKVIEKLRDFYRDYDTISHLIDVKEELANLIPELAESEDERIRKVLVELVKCNERCGYFMINNITTSAMLAWLKRQGKKPVEEYNITGISSGHATGKLREIIKDIESEKVEAKKIEQKPTDNDMKEALRTEYEKGRADAIAEMQVAWSEEDEAKLKSILFHVEDVENKDVIDWLKSLKDRVQPQSTWKPSEEQMTSITCAVRKMKESACFDSELVSLFNDLKRLKK